jgi:peptidoglycan/xylan/chitin deacetylase (PgdA/CDA1 family)
MRVYYEKNKCKIPILVYHSVGIPLNTWAWKYLTIPFKIFAKNIETLYNHGYKSITLSELVDIVSNNREIPKRTIVLTFDDGYLDNWVFVFPLLMKYKMKATFFVPTDFIDPRKIIRKTLMETLSPSEFYGFMSRKELQIMSEYGMDIQSHTMTHTWFFKSNNIIGFRTGNDSYYWMDWNENPSEKFDYLRKLACGIRATGDWRPVYQFSEAIITKRYFPDENFDRLVMEYAKKLARENPNNPNVVKAKLLTHIIPQLQRECTPADRYETDQAYLERIRDEIISSKRRIESITGEKVTLVCWPNGAYNRQALIIAQKSGYLGSTYSSKSERTVFLAGSQMRFKRLYPLYYSKTGLNFILDIALTKNVFVHKIFRSIQYITNTLSKGLSKR